MSSGKLLVTPWLHLAAEAKVGKAMAEDDVERTLRTTLRLKTEGSDTLRNRESTQLEFKETFNLGSLAKYARTMAGFANNRGGFIVFGVANAPHRLKGLNIDKFESCDPAKVTEFLNSYFSPQLEWRMASIPVFGHQVGFIYTHETVEKPTIAIKTASESIKDGEIYFRYNGQTTLIKYPELRAIIESRLLRERQAWLQHLGTIAEAGPTNVGVLDTIHGKLYGGQSPYLVDESLLRELKFLRQGSFSETQGQPVLRLVGEVKPVGGIRVEKPVKVGIHGDDLMEAFLAQRPLDREQACAYLNEAAY